MTIIQTTTNQATETSEATNAPIAEDIPFKKVAIAIAGKTYYVNCPANEEASLHASVSYINNFALELKSDMPRIDQEDLLVLCCLNLYEKLQEQKTVITNERLVSQEADTLVKKLIKDAKSMIG